jgi:hypothetical protein
MAEVPELKAEFVLSWLYTKSTKSSRLKADAITTLALALLPTTSAIP